MEIIRENHAEYTENAENTRLNPLRTQRSLRENDLLRVVLIIQAGLNNDKEVNKMFGC